jgi:hypothetical protein
MPQNIAFVKRLRQLGIPVTFDAYGTGTDDQPYWPRELHRSLPLLLVAYRLPNRLRVYDIHPPRVLESCEIAGLLRAALSSVPRRGCG